MERYNELRQAAEARWEEAIKSHQWVNFAHQNEDTLSRFLELHNEGKESRSWEILDAAWTAHRRKGRKRSASDRSHIPESIEDARWPALMEILQLRADSDRDVIQFRSDVLQDQLVSWDRLVDWMKSTAEADGKTTGWITVPMHDDRTPWSFEDAQSAIVGREWTETIPFVSPKSALVLSRGIRLGGTLWELRRIARRLVEGIGWPEAWTVTFIVTGETPDWPIVFGYDVHDEWTPAMDWLELRVNPRAVSPVELLAVYRKVRSEMMGSKPDDERRMKRLSGKMAELAVFWERTDGKTTGERRVEWNRMHPEWSYPKTTGGNFARDGRKAQRDVTGERA